MANVTLANGRTAVVTADNYSDLAAEQIAYKQANGGLNFQEQSATLTAFRQLAGLGNGFYTSTPTGAAVENSSDAVFKQPLVRLADQISGNAPVGAEKGFSLFQNLTDSGAELAGNAKDALQKLDGSLPGGLTLWVVGALLVGGGLTVYIATR